MQIIITTQNALIVPMLKKLSAKEVWHTAKKLIAKNGKTTTLEIKNKLRKKNYFATQAQVSKAMQKSDFDFTCVVSFRVYF
jgi:arginine repressor